MITFVPDPEPPPTPGAARRWQRLLLASAGLAAVATTQPWVRVQFERLFGSHLGPPGWHSSAGFTCLCTCALVALLAIAETSAPATRQASRPASLLLVIVSALALLLQSWDGPGQLRGVTATWTLPFWMLALSLPALLFACTQRCALLPAGQSSSGPPT